MSMARAITILGSTGSIGQSTLDVVARHQDRYRIVALTANTDVDALEQQCLAWQPEYAVMSEHDCAQQLLERLKDKAPDISVLSGVDGLKQVASLSQVDTVVAGIVGAAGLLPRCLQPSRENVYCWLTRKRLSCQASCSWMPYATIMPYCCR
jgi:1-deoxy-D-xylulose-5-phosphate reductoisomerase